MEKFAIVPMWVIKKAKASSVVVYAILSRFANSEGECWPRMATLKEASNLSENTVRAALEELCAIGAVLIKDRTSETGAQLSNIYAVAWQEPAKFADSESRPPSQKLVPHTILDKSEPKEISSLCPEPQKPKKEDKLAADAAEAIRFLNEKAKARFATTGASLSKARARLADGYTLDNLKAVVEHKSDSWQGTDFEQYLRPSTIFGPEKFPGYLAAAERWIKAGKPAKKPTSSEARETMRRDSESDSAQSATIMQRKLNDARVAFYKQHGRAMTNEEIAAAKAEIESKEATGNDGDL